MALRSVCVFLLVLAGSAGLNGQNISFRASRAFSAGSGPISVAVGLFNGDANTDVVVADLQANAISVLLGNGDGTLQPPVSYSVGNAPVFVFVADVNGDGKLDVIVANGGSNDISVLLGNGDGTFQ